MSPRFPAPDEDFLARLDALVGHPQRFDAALALTLAHFRAESGTIHRLAQGQLELCAHTPGMPPPVLERIRIIPVGKGMAGLALERRAPVTACNLQTDTSGDVRPGARATGLQGSLVVPILHDGEPHGTLGIANREERTFAAEEVALLLVAGEVLAGWLDA